MNPAHVHLVLNHIPVFASVFGLGLLAVAIVLRHDAYQRLALGIFILNALLTIPVYVTGEPAEGVLGSIDPVPETLIEPHEDAAAVTLTLVEVLGLTALGALVSIRRKPAAHRPLVLASVSLGILVVVSTAWTSHLGGLIRHPEITGPAPGAIQDTLP